MRGSLRAESYEPEPALANAQLFSRALTESDLLDRF